MIEHNTYFQIFTIIVVAIIVYPKSLVSFGNLAKFLFKGLGKLLGGFISLVLKIIEELLKLLAVIVSKIFEFLATFFRWLVNLF